VRVQVSPLSPIQGVPGTGSHHPTSIPHTTGAYRAAGGGCGTVRCNFVGGTVMYQDILYRVDDPVAVITMNRPDALNAFTVRMLEELRHALAQAEKDERVVGIVLTGAGRGFCAGMDINALDSMSGGGGRSSEDLSALQASPGDPDMGPDFQVTYGYLLSVRKPIIAAVNGACAGLGFVYALLSDLRFVDRTAKFTTAFSQRGLIAEHG